MHQTLMKGSRTLVVMLLATMLLSYTERHLVKASTSAISPSPTVTMTVGLNQTYVPTSSAVVQTTTQKSSDDDAAKEDYKEKKKIAMIVGGCAGSFAVIVGVLLAVCCHRKENQD